jgi:hypothetical protein
LIFCQYELFGSLAQSSTKTGTRLLILSISITASSACPCHSTPLDRERKYGTALQYETVTVRYDENLTSPPRLKAAVVNTGFGVDGVSATKGHDPRPDCCG